jgi:Zn-dependent protease with chaperone function
VTRPGAIGGRYFDGRSSVARAAQLELDEDGIVRVLGLAAQVWAPLAELVISDRIGRIPRRIVFTDGSTFETDDNDAVDALARVRGTAWLLHAVSRWERRWLPALAALGAVAVIAVLFVQIGIPALADGAAAAMPTSTDRAIGAQSLELLDAALFEPSELPESRQDALQALFRDLVASLDDGHDYRLELRHGGRVGANAFALPAGIVVLTDELCELAQHDEEIVGVIAHEIGHVRGRHALRLLLRNAGVAALSLALLGDVSTTSTLAAAVPTALLDARHSREFETEADDFAYAWLDRNGIARAHFAALLLRLEQSSDGAGYGWLSTHPATSERIRD